VYKRIFEHFRPHLFTDPMVGSGSSVEVAREMGIEAFCSTYGIPRSMERKLPRTGYRLLYPAFPLFVCPA
jgi:hypothetical protein